MTTRRAAVRRDLLRASLAGPALPLSAPSSLSPLSLSPLSLSPLSLSALSLGARPARANATAETARVAIIGAGWGGLACAHSLRTLAPRLSITLIDRDPLWRALPLSNPWLVGRTPERLPRVDLAAWARARGCTFVAAEVQSIERDRRRLRTPLGDLGYDWLVIATGADYDYAAWFGDDTRATAQARERYPAGFQAGELGALERALHGFRGGELLMTVPPAPYRCPPAPYERAMLIAGWIKARGLRAKLTIVDAGAGMQRFNRLFAERHAGRIELRAHSVVRRVDPFARVLVTDEGELRFDHALLLPPMRAGGLIERAGLLGRDARSQPTRWAAVDARTLRSPHDEHVFLVGDAIDRVSELFGYYPKTAHVAVDLGAAAAAQIAHASRGEAAPPFAPPRSLCHVWLDADPPEQMTLDVQFRLRADGALTQVVRQHDNPQPRDEDLHWARELLARRMGISGA